MNNIDEQGETPDLAAMIAIFNCGGCDEDQKTQLARAVELLSQRMARKISARRGVRRDIRDDFVGDSLGILWCALGRYDSNKGPVGPWAWTVLNNDLTDRLRTRVGQPGPLPPDVPEPPQSSVSPYKGACVREERDRWEQRFSDNDMQLIQHWSTRDRVRLLAVSCLWHKVPPHLWQLWCEETVTEMPFPPSSNPGDDLRSWLCTLASALGENWESLKAHWYRKKAKLTTLEFIQGLTHVDL
jgi:DNA-directed RNA polymerase specialized sigma24 family protein